MESISLEFGSKHNSVEVSPILHLFKSTPLKLDCGKSLSNIPAAYRAYGKLNENKDNVILLCHALTGDQYAAEKHPVTEKDGWWQHIVKSDGIIDTDKFFVICPNILGGCMGSFGPNNLANEKEFPVITVEDQVKFLGALLDELGISKIHSIIGGSMGGMHALSFASIFPNRAERCLVIASSHKHSAQNIAFNEIGRAAIMADPDWQNGEYNKKNTFPKRGLSVARMTAHVTYLSTASLERKFGRELQDRDKVTFGFDADFQIESYLRHQGRSFVERFDPNCYLYLTRAMDYFDMEKINGSLENAFKLSASKFCLISFTTDWLYRTEEMQEVVAALASAGKDVRFIEIDSDKGHDAFLLNEPDMFQTIEAFLNE